MNSVPRHRRPLLLTVSMVSAIALTAGCGLGGGPGTDSTQSGGIPKPQVDCDVPDRNVDDKPVDTSELSGEIRFATSSLKKDFGGFFNPLIERFEKEHPGVEVKWEDTPTADDVDARMVNDAQTCVMADVVNVASSTVMALTKANMLMDLDVKAPGSGKDFLPDVWNELDFGAQGHHTVYPWYWGPLITTYNKDIFAKAGLDPEKPPKDWDELVAYSKKIAKSSDGKYQAQWGNAEWTFVDEWVGLGVQMMTPDNKKFTFADDEKSQKWLSDMADLYKAGAIPKDSVTGQPDPSQAYSAGTLAFGSPNASFLRNVKQNAPALYPKTGVGPHLLSPGGSVLFGGQYIGVSATTKNAPLAMAFAQYVTNAENQLAWSKDPGVVIFPSSATALDDEFFDTRAGSDPFEQARAVAVDAARQGKVVVGQFYVTGKINSVINENMQKAIIGEMDPKKALADAQAEANTLLERLN
ncbi:ABC transporter substrate-binding protein [Streptomyces sp. NPDC085927]|uniref:ABC transporter substrate-binding protein n=1 Tax=Streptomyces sp. NPDC085927 TaxID=3365738 RepID=UPI0037D534D4